MIKKLSKLLFCFSILALASFQTEASAYLGSSITYSNVAPGAYLVSLRVYAACGIQTQSQVNLDLKAPGCNSGRLVAMNLNGQASLGNPYCASIPVNCSQPNQYQILTYSTTVTFSAVEQTCPDWVFSWSECCRPNSENVTGQPNAYTEARLKLGASIVNNSARINVLDEPIPVFCLNEEAQYSLNAYDPDCDSLSYELVAPLTAYNTPVTYKPITMHGGNYIVNPTPQPPFNSFNPQLANVPIANQSYSATFPLGSYYINWVNWSTPPQVVPAHPYIDFGQKFGGMRFTPRILMPDTMAGATNRYLVSVLIKEWRKVNGIITQVGSVRRDLAFKITDCGTNRLPYISGISISPAPGIIVCTFDTLGYFNIPAGEQLDLVFTVEDDNITDVLTIETDLASVLPGAQLTLTPISGSNRLYGRISWLATAYTNCDKVRYFRIKVSDNACPIIGKRDFMAGVKVTAPLAPLAIGENLSSSSSFNAYPNPFTEVICFKFYLPGKAETILIYNLLGQEIDKIQLKTLGSGEQKVQWQNASKHAAGTYVARLISEDKTMQTLKFIKLQ